MSRSSFYYEPKGETVLNLTLMRLSNHKFLDPSFHNVRQTTWYLRAHGQLVNEKRVRRLMCLSQIRKEQSSVKRAGEDAKDLDDDDIFLQAIGSIDKATSDRRGGIFNWIFYFEHRRKLSKWEKTALSRRRKLRNI